MFITSFRARLLLLTILLGALPVLASSLFITLRTEQALVWEKQQKLFGITRVLDQYLETSYDDILRERQAEKAERQVQIATLNRVLRQFTDDIAKAYPGVGVGYYSKRLDAIVTYGPSHVYGHTVGRAISQDHQGRWVMETGQDHVQEGALVRGWIMNAMHPVIRNGEIIGYIWANELTEDIQAQVGEMKKSIYVASLIGLLFGLFGVAMIVDNLTAGINMIKKGVFHMQEDLDYRLPRLPAELGEISGAINTLGNELSAKRALEAQVQRAERLAAVGEMAAGLAHEVRNPLMSIRGFAQLLQEDAVNKSQKEYLEIIVRETERMNSLIDQLLYYARPGVNRVQKVEVNPVVENVRKLVESQTRSRNIQLTTRLKKDVPPVACDREQLKQVLLNIVINAIQAVEDNGRIRISSEANRERGCVEVAVEDNGAGILREHQERIFDPFFTTKEQGTGLGLSVAFRLMETWGGTIRVESVKDQGSRFVLSFPLAEEGESA